MAPIATSDSSTTTIDVGQRFTTIDVGQRFGQLKLNVSPAPPPAPIVQTQKKDSVRNVDPFNYVVSMLNLVCALLMCRERLMEMSPITNLPNSFVRSVVTHGVELTSSSQPYSN
jgi:hypothetical protein